MVQFKDFLEETERNDLIVQRSLMEIDTEVLATALVEAQKEIQSIFLRNMSTRACALLTDDIKEKKGTHPSRINSAQELLLQLLQKHAKYATNEEPAADRDAVPAVKVGSYESIIETFRALGAYVRKHGYLPLEALEESVSQPIMRKGIEMLVDGMDPLMAQSILEKCKSAYLRNVETMLNMMLDGFDSLAERQYPAAIEMKLRAHLTQA